ncbi:hypothetical protein AB832_07415 [Flavobacteriaceae bacterium (ex Bugula neritina AB1)]|nr:hypothetical protein AB832_07415 [Flavobacteriaceae bacterium (ex Bugula neritina AB1)]
MNYASVDDLKSYALARGLTLPDDKKCDQLLTLAHDFIETLSYQGAPAHHEQSSAWPRRGAFLNGFMLSAFEVPELVIKAECQAAIDYIDNDLMPTITGQRVLEKSINGVVTTKYADREPVAISKKVMAILKPLLHSPYKLTIGRA